jgi:hypothetical protein
MHPDAHRNLHAEPAPRLLTEMAYFAGDLQSRLHRAAHIVLVGHGVTEHRQ